MTEVIKGIKGFEGRYTISNLGIVRSLLTGKIMKPYVTKFGYARVNLRIAHSRDYKSYFVHRLGAFTFLENKDNLAEVNHKDCNRLNNRVDNLEWMSKEDNIRYSFTHGNASNKGLKNPNAKLDLNDIKAIRSLKATNRFYDTQIAKLFRVSSSTINKIVNNEIWSDN